VEDDEPKYGLAVTGLVHPERIMKNSSLKPGDRLILTKAVGTGVIATALKGGVASPESVDAMVRSMTFLNKIASEVAVKFDVRACTDVTGFGLAGHLVEMARASSCSLRLDSERAPILADALEAASMGLIPAGAHANRAFFGAWTTVMAGVSLERQDLMFDPQTSGGLVLGVPANRAAALREALISAGLETAAEIGEVLEHHPEGHVEIV
jgi:selenide,water dikinase